ncbi:MAG: hypothetical protein ACFFAY_07755 [Promethearchaeota archaeon]
MQLDWIIAWIYAAIGLLALFAIVFIIVSVISLGWALNFVGGKNTDFGSTLISAILMGVLTAFIPCLGCIIALYLLTLRHKIGWGGAIIAWLLSIVIAAVIFIVLVIAFFGGFAAIWTLIPFLPI